MTSIRIITADQLSTELVTAWSDIQRGNPLLDSPFFCPEFTQAVASVRHDVEIAVLEEGGEPRGFFPFQRQAFDTGVPVGGLLSDFHGVIAAADYQWNAKDLLRACGLRVWHFHHLIGQKPFDSFQFAFEPSPYICLRNGFEAYRSDLRNRGSENISHTQKKARKIQREIGPLRLETQTLDPKVMTQMVTWKRSQYQRTGFADVFSYPWTVALLKRILSEPSGSFTGIMSALYAGDSLAAVHVGMRSGRVVHWWFPTYNQDLAKYSPGMILLLEFAQQLDAMGGERIDLGKGASRLKLEFMNGASDVAEGCVDRSPMIWSLRRGWKNTKAWLRESPLRRALQVPADFARRVRDHRGFR